MQAAYCAAKNAERGCIESLRGELSHDGSKVHVTMVQMPALNTPQFGWTKSRLPRKAQPVPPIFQPELAADAIYFAAHAKRRELLVGMPTVEAIVGNKIAPGLLDRYLGNTGYDGQQTNEAENPNRPNNRFDQVPGDHGAHGTFDDRSSRQCAQLWATKNRGVLALGAAALGLACVLLAKGTAKS